MVDFDDFDIGPQSDEFADDLSPNGEDFDSYDDQAEADASWNEDASEAEFYGDAELSHWDDDPSVYDGTYSEE